MLPFPASSSTISERRFLHRSRDFRSISSRRALVSLRSRSRLTNLGVLLLSAFAGISFLYNLAFILSSPPSYPPFSVHVAPKSILSTIARNGSIESLAHLIIVPGHAIWTGTKPEHISDESRWILEHYQQGGGRVAAFTKHILRGAELALGDERSLVVFTGGQTRLHSTTTEAESYIRLALVTGAFQTTASPEASQPSLFARATTENYALDSYQNIVFSIARFHEYTGRYPEKITVVGYEMKRRRFVELHRRALRFPEDRFHYIGIDPSGEGSSGAQEGEFRNGFTPYSVDSYGCHDFLLSKRRQRNLYARFHPYYTSCPELRGLLDWCPGSGVDANTDDATSIYRGPLPWDIYD
ncbi:hypothetical protein BV22DRAFT_1122630 [Leucogyrophana mollusca]|uniref:Uncharacterized protein n=1 Tax=Leucogyrophana mollusca TaxID=85980 RepID=A0ACB8B4V1_9AGAM|nr:hypothetical protein BV22DRAFT_1122630 [Leucogyrophana mollusca]